MSVVFENFSFTYLHAKEPSIKEIDLKIEKGKVALVLGKAGAGKTSLLSSLNGFIPHELPGYQKGDVIVDGVNTRDSKLTELASHVAYSFEDPDAQLLGLTVEEDVAMGPQNLGCTTEETLKRAKWALEAVRLKGFEKRTPDDLSGGEKQSLAIASVLAMRTPIMVMDEPICMLDPLGKERVLSIIRSISKEENKTSIISEAGSDIPNIIPIVDQVILMDRGQVLLNGPPRKVFEDPVFEKVNISPAVTELFLRLRKEYPQVPIPLTVEEASKYLRETIKQKVQIKGRKVEEEARPGARVRETILKIRNLKHVYPGGVEALKGVNVDIYEGEMVGLIGQNGSGKTTMALHVVGLLKPTNPEAEVVLCGLDVPKHAPRDVIRFANYVFQNPSDQIIEETVEEEVAYGSKMLGLAKDEVNRRVEKMLKLFHLEGKRKDYCEFLTRGEKTSLAIASICAMEPKLLLIDEPTTGMDYAGTIRVMNTLREINKEGTTIIIITHNMRTIAEYTSRTIVMNQGKLIMDGPTRDVFSRPQELEKAWIRPCEISELGQSLRDFGFPGDLLRIDEAYDLIEERMTK